MNDVLSKTRSHGPMHETKRLTVRQMRFVMYLDEFVFNATRRAYLAGYSKHSARWQAWRLNNSIPVRIFQNWWTTNDRYFATKGEIASLKNELAKVGYSVSEFDIKEASLTLRPFSYDNVPKRSRKFVKFLFRDTFGYTTRVGDTLVTKKPQIFD